MRALGKTGAIALSAVGMMAMVAVAASAFGGSLPLGDGQSSAAERGQSTAGCQILPHKDAFHRKVTKLKTLKGSSKMIRHVRGSDLHPDFGSNPHYGIPYTVVPHSQRKVKVHIRRSGDGAPGESDKGRQPIPPNARIEGGKRSSGDRHTLVIQRGKRKGSPCKLIELYKARYDGGHGHKWSANQQSVFDLSRKLPQRPKGWTSADAAGLPILPGLVRYQEVKRGKIKHAIRITFAETRAAYRSPATHFASESCSSKLPAMGDRLRLKRGYSIGGMSRDSKVVAKALKTYGAIVADNGSDFYISGSSDRRWNDGRLDDLKSIPGTAFQFVDTNQKLTKSGSC